MIVSNFLKRAISGLLFVIVLTGCIFIHPICFYILFFIINILGLMRIQPDGETHEHPREPVLLHPLR